MAFLRPKQDLGAAMPPELYITGSFPMLIPGGFSPVVGWTFVNNTASLRTHTGRPCRSVQPGAAATNSRRHSQASRHRSRHLVSAGFLPCLPYHAAARGPRLNSASVTTPHCSIPNTPNCSSKSQPSTSLCIHQPG